MKRKLTIRLNYDITNPLDNFAKDNGMSSTAAAEFFVKLGIESLQKMETFQERFDTLDEHLKEVYQSLFKMAAYTGYQSDIKKEILDKANEKAIKATEAIFNKKD
jgi:hypothetical protein